MTVLFTDPLTYSNGALATLNTSYSDVSVGGSVINISSNNAVTSAAANDARIRYTGNAFTQARQYATATMGSCFTTGGVGAGMGVVVKCNTGGADTAIRLIVSGAGWELARFNAGAFTSLGSASSTTWAAADTATIDYNGSTGAWAVQKNGSNVTSGTGTDGSPLASGQSGIAYSSVGNSASGIDAIEFGDFTSGAATVPPTMYFVMP